MKTITLLFVALLVAGCDQSANAVEKAQFPVYLAESTAGGYDRMYDPQFGIVCYWRDHKTLSCVKVEKQP